VVGLEITEPTVDTLEVGETLQLSARALDRDGNTVSVPISWRAADATLIVDGAGLVSAVSPGPGRVQAFVSALSSPLVSFTIIARPDTLILVGDSIVTVAPTATASTPLVTRLESLSPAAPLASLPVVYTVTSPPDVEPHSVELSGGVLVDTLLTGEDGTVQSAVLSRVAGVPSPDTAIVEVRAFRIRGAPVPGSAQRFIVLFQ
jgi:hypothetical protein